MDARWLRNQEAGARGSVATAARHGRPRLHARATAGRVHQLTSRALPVCARLSAQSSHTDASRTNSVIYNLASKQFPQAASRTRPLVSSRPEPISSRPARAHEGTPLRHASARPAPAPRSRVPPPPPRAGRRRGPRAERAPADYYVCFASIASIWHNSHALLCNLKGCTLGFNASGAAVACAVANCQNWQFKTDKSSPS